MDAYGWEVLLLPEIILPMVKNALSEVVIKQR